MENEKQLIRAFLQEPTIYTLDVIDASMLPKNMAEKKTIDFVIKPPTTDTLLRTAMHLLNIPADILEKEQVTLQDVAPYGEFMVKALCTMSWARKDPYPDWYEPFILQNTTPNELYLMFAESALKMKTDFFLSSFHIANQNPMTLRKPKKEQSENPDDSTPTSS